MLPARRSEKSAEEKVANLVAALRDLGLGPNVTLGQLLGGAVAPAADYVLPAWPQQPVSASEATSAQVALPAIEDSPVGGAILRRPGRSATSGTLEVLEVPQVQEAQTSPPEAPFSGTGGLEAAETRAPDFPSGPVALVTNEPAQQTSSWADDEEEADVVVESEFPDASDDQLEEARALPESEQERASRMTEAWRVTELLLEKAVKLGRATQAAEREAFEALDAFREEFGGAAKDVVEDWPQLVSDRREELAKLTDYRRKRRGEREARARKEREELARLEALRKEQERLEAEKARVARASERRMREVQRKLADANARALFQELNLRKLQLREEERAAHPKEQRCFVCGQVGVSRSNRCPNLHNHRDFLE